MPRLAQRFGLAVVTLVLLGDGALEPLTVSAAFGQPVVVQQEEPIQRSVVRIHVKGESEIEGDVTEFASGVIVSNAGYVVTAFHPFSDRTKKKIDITSITVRIKKAMEGPDLDARFIAYSADSDLAIIRIMSGTPGRAADFCLGYAPGRKEKLTAWGFPVRRAEGGTARVPRDLTDRSGVFENDNAPGNTWQTDIQTVEGMSGGPVVNQQGAVVGITVSKGDGTASIQKLGLARLLLQMADINDPPNCQPSPETSRRAAAKAAEQVQNRAKELINDEEYASAVTQLNRALQLDPNLNTAFLYRGIAHYHLTNFALAFKDLNDAVARAPDDYEAHLYLGLTYAELEKYEAAINEFNRAINISRSDSRAYDHLGVAYESKALAEPKNRLENFDRARRALEDGLQVNPRYHESWANLSHVHTKKGQYLSTAKMRKEADVEFDLAVVAANKGLKVNSGHAPLHNNRGIAFRNKDELEQIATEDSGGERVNLENAIRDYEAAIHLDSFYMLAHQNLGEAKMERRRNGDLDAAFDEFDMVIRYQGPRKTRPRDRGDLALAQMNRGVALLIKGEPQKAIVDLKAAVALRRNQLALYNLGTAYFNAGRSDEAIATLKEALLENSRDVESRILLGRVFHSKKDYTRAISHYRDALRLDPYSFHAHYWLGESLHRSKNVDEAIKAYSEAIRIRPKYTRALFGRCWVHATSRKNFDAALSDCGRVLADKKDIGYRIRALNTLGVVYLHLRRFKQALQAFAAASKHDASKAYALYGMGLSKLRLGDRSGGTLDITTARRLDARVDAQFHSDHGLVP